MQQTFFCDKLFVLDLNSSKMNATKNFPWRLQRKVTQSVHLGHHRQARMLGAFNNVIDRGAQATPIP